MYPDAIHDAMPEHLRAAVMLAAHADPLPADHADDCAGCLVHDLPDGFRFHDLRHCFASLLVASGPDVKVVQACLLHASAKTTLDTYGHLWPDRDDTRRAAVDAVPAARSVPRAGRSASPRTTATGEHVETLARWPSSLLRLECC